VYINIKKTGKVLCVGGVKFKDIKTERRIKREREKEMCRGRERERESCN